MRATFPLPWRWEKFSLFSQRPDAFADLTGFGSRLCRLLAPSTLRCSLVDRGALKLAPEGFRSLYDESSRISAVTSLL